MVSDERNVEMMEGVEPNQETETPKKARKPKTKKKTHEELMNAPVSALSDSEKGLVIKQLRADNSALVGLLDAAKANSQSAFEAKRYADERYTLLENNTNRVLLDIRNNLEVYSRAIRNIITIFSKGEM